MEPDIRSSYSCSLLLPVSDDVRRLGSQEEEFGDFSLRIVCSPLGLVHATEPKSFLRCPSPAVKPATHQPNSAKSESDGGLVDVKGSDCKTESSNGHVEGDLKSGAFSASMLNPPEEETGFADFTLFTEQAGNPWCCGFTKQREGRVEGANSSGQNSCNSGQEFITDSEPRSQLASKEYVCIKRKHCEKRSAALVKPSQHHHQPQEATAASSFASALEEPHIPGNTQECMLTEDGTASDLQASSCEDFSFESASAELEPNGLSVASRDVQVKELENCRHADSLMPELDLHHCNHYVTQETSSTSNQTRYSTGALEKFAHFTRDQEPFQSADAVGIQRLGSLPLSDSFADFCSASTQEDEEGLWADFKDQSIPLGKDTWILFREPVSKLHSGKYNEEELERPEKYQATRGSSCQPSLSCHVQQLLHSSFPEVLVPAVDGKEQLINLKTLLQTQNLHESEEEPEVSPAVRIQQLMLRPHEDLLWSLGLQFQWGGSHTKSSLLGCLGVNMRNIVFMGTKEPVTLPSDSYRLGILEPTKESLPALNSPGRLGSPDMLDPSTQSVQVFR